MTQPKINASQLGTTTFTLQFLLETGANNTYALMQSARFPFTINAAYYQTTAGTITANVRISTVSVTGLSALSLTGSPANTSASGANSVAINDLVDIVFSSNSSATFVSVMLECTRV